MLASIRCLRSKLTNLGLLALSDEPRPAPDQVFLLERSPADGVAAHVLLDGDGPADRILAGARRSARYPRAGNGAVVRLLGKTGQQVGLAVGRFRPSHACSSRGLQPPDLTAPGTPGSAFEVPERIRIEKILRFTTGACQQHGLSPRHPLRCTPVLQVSASLPRLGRPVCPGCTRCRRPLVSAPTSDAAGWLTSCRPGPGAAGRRRWGRPATGRPRAPASADGWRPPWHSTPAGC